MPTKLDCKIYRQTEAELKALKTYIDKSLAKGYITETNSPYASPLFFQAKSDGKLRPMVNYRALNAWTVCNVYPLPLIGSIINHLQGKTVLTYSGVLTTFGSKRKTSGKQHSKHHSDYTRQWPCHLEYVTHPVHSAGP
jgi:hypothetical protein